MSSVLTRVKHSDPNIQLHALTVSESVAVSLLLVILLSCVISF